MWIWLILLYYIFSTGWIYSKFKYYKNSSYVNFNKTDGVILKADISLNNDCYYLSLNYIYYVKGSAIIGHKHIFPDLEKYNEKEFIESLIEKYPANKKVTVYYRQINKFPCYSYDSYLEIDTIKTQKFIEWYYDLFLYNTYFVILVLGLEVLGRFFL